MKLIPLILALSVALNTTAQEQTESILPAKERKNEIGLLFDPGVSGYNPQTHNSIQYKRWVKPDSKAYRLNIGYGKFNKFSGDVIYPNLGDTVVRQHSISDIPQIHAGVGVEMQRHFYKSVYMYAAIDLYAAYGSGNTDEVLDKEVFDKNGESIFRDQELIGNSTTQQFTMGVLPLVGVKLQFSRISFGTELTGIKTEYSVQSFSSKPTSGGLVDFNMGDFTQRIFINYRF